MSPPAGGFPFRSAGPRRRSADVIHVGLVNNMPDAALRATELQFGRLLQGAAGDFDVRLHLFAILSVKRSELTLTRMEGAYASTDSLPSSNIDALIVTGAEPLAPDLRDEPYWNDLARLIDWAKEGTLSTVFSCLASHAAVLHLDGIARRPLPQKLSGVFDCACAPDDPLLAGMQLPFEVPHARLNGLSGRELLAKGYSIASRLGEADVNVFWRKLPSTFVFLQCHPEYDADTLGREYIRDVGRYLRGENAWRPPLPQNYYDKATEIALAALDDGGRNPELLARYTEVTGQAQPLHAWRRQTLTLFGNWLKIVAAEKIRLSEQYLDRPQRRARRSF